MQVYYYQVLSRLRRFIIPGVGEMEPKLPGDVLEVNQQAHEFFQSESCPFKGELALVGSTYLGEPAAEAKEVEKQGDKQEEKLEKQEKLEKKEDLGADPVLAGVLQEESLKGEVLELPPPGSKVSEVLAYLDALEKRGYVPDQLEEVKGRFRSARVLQEVERLQQAFLEQSLSIEG